MEIEKIKKTGLLLLFAGNLFFIAAAYYFRQDNASLKELLDEMTASRDSAVSEKVALQAEMELLQDRLKIKADVPRNTGQEIANLERPLDLRDEELQQLKKQLDGLPQPAAGVSTAENEARPRRGWNLQERMERLKEENPEEFERMQIRMNEFQKRREEQAAGRELFFKNLDVTKLNDDQRRLLSEYQELLANNEQMLNNLWQNGQPPNFQEMMEQGRVLREMSGNVRDIMLQNLGNHRGTSGESLSSSVQEILDMTSTGGGGRFTGGRESSR